MSQLRSALRRAGGCAAALALIGSSAMLLAPAVDADPAAIRVVAIGGTDTDNDCTLTTNPAPCATIQHAVDEANAGDTVSVEAGAFDVTPPIWAFSRVAISKSITLQGAGADKTLLTTTDNGMGGGAAVYIDGSGDGQHPIVVQIQDLSLVDDGSGYNYGVVVESGGANLTLDRVSISGYMNQGLQVEAGPGSENASNVNVNSSTISDSEPGVELDDGTLSVQSSTIANNRRQGIFVRGGAATITDSTIAGTSNGDRASGPLGGLVAGQGGGEGLGATATVEIAGSIVASQQDKLPDCVEPDVAAGSPAAMTSDGYNLDSDGSCGFDKAGDHSTVNPELGALQDNGGPTKTMMPLAGSPAIDAIPNETGSCVTDFPTDQRGTTRPIGSGCDIGAVETPAAVPPPPSSPTCPPLVIDTTTLPDGTVGAPYSVQLQASGGCDSAYTWTVPSEAPEGGFPSAGAQSTAPGGEQNPAARRALGRTPPPPSPQPTTSTPRPPVNTPTVHSSPVSAPTSSTAAPTESSSSTEAAGNSAPPGLSLSADGVLSGTPTQAGTFTFTVSVNDPVLATLVLHVGAAATGTPTATSSTPAPSTSHGVGGVSTTAAPPATATLSASTGPLANTGASVGPQLRLALMLLVGGGAMVLAGVRRRRQPRRH
ncbi:MAG TPA: choice-of-anchor Q domain-containing protein [Jatrophihabitantaceae bacterium]|nr:choice-of-anchor Q domain-containing protein [Jatrophihabitantaceae bacterium]